MFPVAEVKILGLSDIKRLMITRVNEHVDGVDWLFHCDKYQL